MAYEQPPQHKDFVGKQWASCMLLVNAHRTGKHLTIVANQLDTMVKMKEDQMRSPLPMPQVK